MQHPYIDWVNGTREKCSIHVMRDYCEKYQKSESFFKIGDIIHVKDRMQNNYSYQLTSPIAHTAEDLKTRYYLNDGQIRVFKPNFHPREMLAMGIFEGRYLNDCLAEFPKEWFHQAICNEKVSPHCPSNQCNLYGKKSRQSLHKWCLNKWIHGLDVRGWFQWFCRYALGRRDRQIDTIQMKRWAQISRWYGILQRRPSDTVRQALLQWSWPQK